jgi:GGDEF domain-containing protein
LRATAARFGGEECALILAKTLNEGALEVVEAIGDALRDRELHIWVIPLASSPFLSGAERADQALTSQNAAVGTRYATEIRIRTR